MDDGPCSRTLVRLSCVHGLEQPAGPVAGDRTPAVRAGPGRRGRTRVPAQATFGRADGDHPARVGHAVRRAALPQPLQLPRRRQQSHRSRGGGESARLERVGTHRSRQLRRSTALRRGQHRLRPPQHLRRRAQSRTQRTPERRARSGRFTSAGPGQGSGGISPARLGNDRGTPGGRREGQAVVRRRRAHRHRARPLGDSHRLPQGDAVAGGDRRPRRPLRPRPRRRRAQWPRQAR